MKLIVVLGVIVVLVLFLGFLITEVMFHISYRSYQFDPLTGMEHYEDYKEQYPREVVHFYSGANRLQGYIYGDIHAEVLLVFSHGIWSSSEEYMTMLTWFLKRGYCVFAYDYTAYNGSEGKSAKGLPQSPLDLDAALTFIESQPRLKDMKKVTMGHSWGAYATAAGLYFQHDILAACAMSGFYDPIEISVATGRMLLGPMAVVMKPWVWLLNRLRFGRYHRLLAVDGINRSGIPVLLTHGLQDDFIRYDVSSIVSQREQITNPKVQYYIIEEPGRCGHNDFLLCKDAAQYMQDVQKGYEQLKKQYKKGKVPEDVKRAYFEKVDKKRANAPALDLLEVIDGFFQEALLDAKKSI